MIPLDDEQAWRRAREFAALQRAQWAGRLDSADLREHQRINLQWTVNHCQTHSTFYRGRLDGVGAAFPLDAVPFTTKNDLREHLDEVPSQSLDQSWIYYETTGTTGTSTPCPRSVDDSVRTAVALSEGYRELLTSYGKRLVFAVMGPTELHSTGDTFGDVFRNLGHTSVKMWPHSPVVGYKRAMELLARLPIDGMVCTPGMAILLARQIADQGLRPDSMGVSVIFTLGELATPRLLEQIGRVWGAEVHNCMYASQEASVLAVCGGDGRLRTTPLNYHYEVIDPQTGERLDDELEAREGEMVVTHLYQGSKPLVRYKTGDLVRVLGAGQDVTVVPLGRARDRLVVGGQAYTAYDFEEVLLEGCPPFLDYQASIEERDGHDALEILLEPVAGDYGTSRTTDQYADAVCSRLGVPVSVVWGSTDERTSTGAMVSWKAARIRDRRVSADGEVSSSQQIARQRAVRVK